MPQFLFFSLRALTNKSLEKGIVTKYKQYRKPFHSRIETLQLNNQCMCLNKKNTWTISPCKT